MLVRDCVVVDNEHASLPFPLPTYATDVVLGGVCISQSQRARAVAFLDLGLVILWRKFGLYGSSSPFATSDREVLEPLGSVNGMKIC